MSWEDGVLAATGAALAVAVVVAGIVAGAAEPGSAVLVVDVAVG